MERFFGNGVPKVWPLLIRFHVTVAQVDLCRSLEKNRPVAPPVIRERYIFQQLRRFFAAHEYDWNELFKCSPEKADKFFQRCPLQPNPFKSESYEATPNVEICSGMRKLDVNDRIVVV